MLSAGVNVRLNAHKRHVFLVWFLQTPLTVSSSCVLLTASQCLLDSFRVHGTSSHASNGDCRGGILQGISRKVRLFCEVEGLTGSLGSVRSRFDCSGVDLLRIEIRALLKVCGSGSTYICSRHVLKLSVSFEEMNPSCTTIIIPRSSLMTQVITLSSRHTRHAMYDSVQVGALEAEGVHNF